MADLSSQIETNAAGPKKAKSDEGEFEQHSLKEQIEADRYLNNRGAARAKGFGLRVVRAKTSSSLGE
jgi:hypothetical protein